MRKFLLGTVGLLAPGLGLRLRPLTWRSRRGPRQLRFRCFTIGPASTLAATAAGVRAATALILLMGLVFSSLTLPRALRGPAGGQIGYRWQASQWVFGVEAQGDSADLSNQRISLINPAFSTRTTTDAIGLFTGQIGYAWNPRVADLAGEEPDSIGRGARGERRIDQADALVAEIRPIALGFHAEHPLAGLPTITDLAAGQAPGALAATVSDENAKRINEIKAVAALTPAAVAANVEAGPIVKHRKRSWRGPRLDRHVSGRSRSPNPECKQTNRTEQKLPHRNFSIAHRVPATFKQLNWTSEHNLRDFPEKVRDLRATIRF